MSVSGHYAFCHHGNILKDKPILINFLCAWHGKTDLPAPEPAMAGAPQPQHIPTDGDGVTYRVALTKTI